MIINLMLMQMKNLYALVEPKIVRAGLIDNITLFIPRVLPKIFFILYTSIIFFSINHKCRNGTRLNEKSKNYTVLGQDQ